MFQHTKLIYCQPSVAPLLAIKQNAALRYFCVVTFQSRKLQPSLILLKHANTAHLNVTNQYYLDYKLKPERFHYQISCSAIAQCLCVSHLHFTCKFAK